MESRKCAKTRNDKAERNESWNFKSERDQHEEQLLSQCWIKSIVIFVKTLEGASLTFHENLGALLVL